MGVKLSFKDEKFYKNPKAVEWLKQCEDFINEATPDLSEELARFISQGHIVIETNE